MLSLLALALAIAVWLARRGRAVDGRVRAAGWLLVAALAGLAVVISPPLVVLRKLIAFVLMPATLVWIALVVLLARSWAQPRRRWPLLALVAGYSAAGSPLTSYLLLHSLEKPFENIRPLADGSRYDAVMVMGGGTSPLPDEDCGWRPPEWLAGRIARCAEHDPAEVQLGPSGDRVRLAAALYAAGQAPVLVSSGSSVDGQRDLSAETTNVWIDMGVPAAAIARLPAPRNSAEEIAAYVRLAQERGWKRIGLVTSARHLPRALALCRRHGLAVDPLPSDFRADPPVWDLTMIVPNGKGFEEVESAVWEYVGIAAVHLIGG